MPSDVDRVLAPYDDLVATALRPKVEDRYQTAAEFRDAIQQALVAVNPTISTDQLGAFMRELFSHEMTAQRELHDRIAKTHLEDFQDQLTTQVGSTISFALANMPLQAPPEAPRPKLPTRNSGAIAALSRPRPPTAPTDILKQQPPQPPPIPTSVIPTTELSLADGTGAMVTENVDELAPRRTKTPLVIAIVAGISALGLVAFALSRGDDPPKPPAKVAKATQPQIRVETIPPEEQQAPPRLSTVRKTPEKIPVKAPVPEKAEKVDTDKPEKKTERRVDKRRDREPKKVEAPKPPRPELTREAVASKFRAARQAYDAYKQKNGGRYDQEWNDLASYVQYHPNDLDEVARRIDSFRSKLRE